MVKLSKPKSFTVSNETLEVDFKGTICECANLLKSGIKNQSIVLVAHKNVWHEIDVLDHGADNSDLNNFKNYVESMKLSLIDFGITTELVKKTSTILTHNDFMLLSEKFPPHDYIEISKLNDYNVKSVGKSSVDELKDWLKVCQRDNISIEKLIQNREIEKQKIIMELKNVEKIEVVEAVIISNEIIEKPAENVTKKPISLQVFETLTPERISELQGLNERQLLVVKENPVIKITDKESYELAKKTAAILLKASTAIDGSTGIEATATKYLNTFKSMLKNALAPIAKLTRDPYNDQKTIISKWENAELLKQQAIEREKLTKIKKRTDELFAVPFTFNGSIYSIGTVYCTPSQVENATDEDFLIIVNNGKAIKTALDAEALVQSAKDQRIAELEEKLAKLEMLDNMSNTDPEPVNTPATTNSEKIVGPTVVQEIKIPINEPKQATTYVLPAQENKLLNALDLKNVEHLEKPAYIKCRVYYVQGLIDAASEIEFILKDETPNPIKKSERISIFCEILKKSV